MPDRHHAWFGRSVGVYGGVQKPDGIHLRCIADGVPCDRWLEVPAWMFERASFFDDLDSTTPHVGLTALCALSALLDQLLKVADRYEKDSNQRVKEAITLVFDEVKERGSAR